MERDGRLGVSTRCQNCDRQLATQADHDAIAEGDGEHLCWARYGSPCESVDWRALALEARAERDAIAAAAEAHDREVRARVWEEADALLDAEGPGRVYHERLLRARAAEERGR